MARRGVLRPGEKVQFTDRRGKRITDQLREGGVSQTEHGLIVHDDVIGSTEGTVVTTVRALHRQDTDMSAAAATDDPSPTDPGTRERPWKATRAIGGWQYCVMRPRLADYVLSMPRGAQIMYPKDIAQVIQLGDIRRGMHVVESGAGSGAMSLNLLDAIGPEGRLTSIELRGEFARVAEANATLYFGVRPSWWDLRTGDFDGVAADLPPHDADRIVLDMLDPWNRLEAAHRVIRPGGVLIAYVTTTTQMVRLTDRLREDGRWTEPEIGETLERAWKAEGLAVRPDHQMIGHTGFLVVSRAMAEGTVALKRHERATKDVHSDIDALTPEERAARLAELELRDISDRKLRKVLRDLDVQTALLHDATDHDDQAVRDSSSHAATSNDETSTDVTSTKAPSNDAEHHA